MDVLGITDDSKKSCIVSPAKAEVPGFGAPTGSRPSPGGRCPDELDLFEEPVKNAWCIHVFVMYRTRSCGNCWRQKTIRSVATASTPRFMFPGIFQAPRQAPRCWLLRPCEACHRLQTGGRHLFSRLRVPCPPRLQQRPEALGSGQRQPFGQGAPLQDLLDNQALRLVRLSHC